MYDTLKEAEPALAKGKRRARKAELVTLWREHLTLQAVRDLKKKRSDARNIARVGRIESVTVNGRTLLPISETEIENEKALALGAAPELSPEIPVNEAGVYRYQALRLISRVLPDETWEQKKARYRMMDQLIRFDSVPHGRQADQRMRRYHA
jgi:hypothetical protein